MAQSLEMTEPFNAPYSEVKVHFNVLHCSEVTGSLPSSERIVSSQVLNNKEKTHTETINPNTSCMCFGIFEDDVCYWRWS